MSFVELKDVGQREVVPGCRARFVHSDSMTISYWDLEAGAVIPDHAHPHEQISTIVTGEMELTIGDEKRLMRPGMVAVIPSGVRHIVHALIECYVIDVFHPVREEYR